MTHYMMQLKGNYSDSLRVINYFGRAQPTQKMYCWKQSCKLF